MKAAVLKSFGSPLVIENVPEPVLGTGEVIVDVVATRVLSYMNEVFSGERNYALDLPIIPGPGGIGRVRAIGPDATKLAVGDWVFCDPTVRSRDDVVAPDIALQGLTAAGPGGMRLQQHFRHGSYAEQMRGADRERQARSARSRPRKPRNGARWGRCWCPMAASSPPTFNPARPCW